MEKKDYYKILGVNNKSTTFEIKKAYKRLAIKYHPDRNKGDKLYEEKFKEIKEAYEVLSDSKKRSMYDQYGHVDNTDTSDFTADFSTTSDLGDIFGDVFGDIFGTKKSKSNKKGTDVQYDINLTLEDVLNGVNKQIQIYIMQKCSLCHGSGCRSGYEKKICNICKGTGRLQIRQGFFTLQQTCHNCNGECYIISDPCYICKGEGIEKTLKTIIVKIPAGVDNNDRIKLVGKGNCGSFGCNPGDLYICVKVKKHNIFNREGNNLYCNVPINFSLAALGGVIEVPTLLGNIKLKIPPETQTGKLFRIRNRGIKFLKKNMWGDLFCRVYIETPVNLNKYQKKLLYNLGFSLTGNNKEINNPKSTNFINKVKKFFSNLTK